MTFALKVDGYDVTGLAGELEWSSNKDTVGKSLSFEMPFDETNLLMPDDFVNVGHKVSLTYNKSLVFFGIVFKKLANGRQPRAFTCYDLAFYLNKNTVTKQFNKKTASQCIQELCKEQGIKLVISNIPVAIKKIYKATSIIGIIEDILKTAEAKLGIRYRYEMRGDTLAIFNWKDISVGEYVIAQDFLAASNETSIEDMKNSIEIVADGEKTAKVLAISKDDKNISKYGLLRLSETIDEKEKSKAKQVANNRLKELNRVMQAGVIQVEGNVKMDANRLLKVVEPITGLKGNYLITDAKHSFKNGIYLSVVSLESEQ